MNWLDILTYGGTEMHTPLDLPTGLVGTYPYGAKTPFAPINAKGMMTHTTL
jgi:hypothetical protein